jgi:hypothetical protein
VTWQEEGTSAKEKQIIIERDELVYVYRIPPKLGMDSLDIQINMNVHGYNKDKTSN